MCPLVQNYRKTHNWTLILYTIILAIILQACTGGPQAIETQPEPVSLTAGERAGVLRIAIQPIVNIDPSCSDESSDIGKDELSENQ